MKNHCGWLTAIMVVGALAIPASAPAQAQSGQGNNKQAAPHNGGGGSNSFTPHAGGQSFAPRNFAPRAGGQSFTPRFSGRTRQFGTVHQGTTFNRSVRGAQRLPNRMQSNSNTRSRGLHNFTQSNTNNRTLRNTAGTQTNAARTLRRNGTAAITPQAARQGRFGSRFAARSGHQRFANIAAHRAWQRGYRAGFVPWYGPVFWPYAYSDIFDYAFWPGGYDDGFWFYAYDDFFDGLFWGEAGPPEAYAYAGPALAAAPRASYAGVEELCKQPGSGITAWPFRDIERKVGLNDEQKQLLGDVRKAAADAAATFKASCPAENTFPLTPPGRLQAMTARLQGTLDAVQVVRPALDKFYASLSDEQKERFNTLGPKRPVNNPETTAALPQDAKSCGEAKPGLANLPIEKIEDAVKPTDTQQDALKQLQEATDKAVSVLQAACPEDMPLTPPGRLEAMETRLKAMIEAAKTVKPALEGFYASLTNEQKARFDRIGGQLAQGDG